MTTISGLQWHQDLDEARRHGRPVLSLRLLGRLDQEMSCANSRFFRSTLYPTAMVSRVLRDRFALHWRSVRPVPRVTIDFGDGRRYEQTLTGNSVHLVLDGRGQAVDAIPGLYDAGGFARLAGAAADLAVETTRLDGHDRVARLERWHASRHDAILRAWSADLAAIGAAGPTPREETTDWAALAALRVAHALPDRDVRDRIGAAMPQPRPPDARAAGRLAPTKMAVERPLLDAVLPLAATIAEDAVRNEYTLHRRVHEAFALGEAPSDPDELSAWIYRELFQMPLDDPWLGLGAAAFAAGGSVERRV